jgi:hypothetical protein
MITDSMMIVQRICSATFVRHHLHQNESALIARVVSRCREAEYRVGESDGRLLSNADLPPTNQSGKIGTLSLTSQNEINPGSLANFASVCPQSQEARTAAHNQARKLISSLLAK